MRTLFLPALVAAFSLYMACTPKSGANMASTPTPAQEPAVWDTMGKPVMGDEPEEEPVEYAAFDEAEVRPEPAANPDTLGPYNPSHTFEHDLIHTKIEISFDWEKKRANATATLTLRPWFYATDKLTLDAKNFDIHSVSYVGKTEQLKYKYDNAQLTIDLGKTYTRNDEFKVAIQYTAKPDERESFGGSAAITQDKGLYFINADGADKGEAEAVHIDQVTVLFTDFKGFTEASELLTPQELVEELVSPVDPVLLVDGDRVQTGSPTPTCIEMAITLPAKSGSANRSSKVPESIPAMDITASGGSW